MKIMKKIVKSKVFIFVVTAITFSSISVYAAGRYYATQVDYEPSNPNFNVDNMSDALDQLYTIQNTTVNNLNSQITTKDQTISNLNGQISTKDQTISNLQSQVESLTAAASNSYVTGTFKINAGTTNSPDLGFYPSKLLMYNSNSSWGALMIVTRSSARCVDSWGGSNADCSQWVEMTNTGFRTKGYSSTDPETKSNWTYYAFR